MTQELCLATSGCIHDPVGRGAAKKGGEKVARLALTARPFFQRLLVFVVRLLLPQRKTNLAEASKMLPKDTR